MLSRVISCSLQQLILLARRLIPCMKRTPTHSISSHLYKEKGARFWFLLPLALSIPGPAAFPYSFSRERVASPASSLTGELCLQRDRDGGETKAYDTKHLTSSSRMYPCKSTVPCPIICNGTRVEKKGEQKLRHQIIAFYYYFLGREPMPKEYIRGFSYNHLCVCWQVRGNAESCSCSCSYLEWNICSAHLASILVLILYSEEVDAAMHITQPKQGLLLHLAYLSINRATRA